MAEMNLNDYDLNAVSKFLMDRLYMIYMIYDTF